MPPKRSKDWTVQLFGCTRLRENVKDTWPSRCGRIGASCFALRTARHPKLILWITIRRRAAMPMKNPSHPGQLIKADIDELGLTLVDAAKGLGISRQQLHSVIVGRAGVTPEMAISLKKAIGTTPDTCPPIHMNYALTQVRT